MPAGLKLLDCKVLAMDYDSTLINIERSTDEIAGVVGVKDKVSEITEAAMRAKISDLRRKPAPPRRAAQGRAEEQVCGCA